MNTFRDKYPLISALTTYDKNYKFDDKLIDFYSTRHFDYIKTNSSSQLLSKYFGSKLHDSPILKIQTDANTLSITLNDSHSYDFALETCAAKDLKKKNKELIFHLTIKFYRPILKLSRINKNGKIIYVKTEKYLPMLAYWLYDEVTFLSTERVKLGALLETSPYKGNKGSLLLEIDAQAIEFLENQKEQYLKLFGNTFLPYWEHFEENWASNGYVHQEKMALILEDE